MIRVLVSHFGLRPWEIADLTEFQKMVYITIFFEDIKFAKDSRMRF